MREKEQPATAEQTTGRGRSIPSLLLVATLSLWTLGTLHVAEHDVRHDTAPCGTCIAVAADGLVGNVTLTVDRQPDAGTEVVCTHQDPARTQRVVRLSARAPPPHRA
ncbi:MAG: hypothetical protein P8R42_12815 [Candidatus Binatia bacterium]|nr:hypothetical protein [Candidatus Binatia bacterium]